MRKNQSNMQSIEDRLRAERPARKAPGDLTDRVMSNLPSHIRSRPESEPTFAFWPRFALGVALVAVIATASLHYLRPNPQQHPGPTSASPTPMATLPPADSLDIALPQIQSGQIEALSLHLDQPLQKELQYVISDTRQAIQFVAASFLPEK
jgi:hypothetical protein